MRDTTLIGIKSVLLGLFGNMGVSAYAWFSHAEIFDPALSKTMKYTLFGQISCGDLSQCVYMMIGLGALFIITGILMIFDKKHFI